MKRTAMPAYRKHWNIGENLMPLDGAFGGEEPHGPWCAHCKAPILKDERSVRLHFDTDPYGFDGLSGEYHERCSKPFASIAHALDMLSFRRF